MSLSKPVAGRNPLKGLARERSCGHELGALVEKSQEVPRSTGRGEVGPTFAQERLEALKMIASLLERLAQAGVSWSEIYQLVTQASESLSQHHNDAKEPKNLVVSRFREAVNRAKRAVSARMEKWMTGIASSLLNLVRSSAFRKTVNSLLAIALSLQLTAPVLAADSKQNTLAPSVKAALVDSSGLGSQDETVFSLFRIADAEAPDNQPETESLDLETSLDILGQYGYLDELLMQIMVNVKSNNQEEVRLSNLFVKDSKGLIRINYNDISSGRLHPKDGKLEVVNDSGTPVDQAIGIVYLQAPYVVSIRNENSEEERIQFSSGVSYAFGHCCGVHPDYRVFANLANLQPGNQVEITTTDKLEYSFSVWGVGNVPKESSMDMIYSDYKNALRFLASVLLSTPDTPVSPSILEEIQQILNTSQNISSAMESLQRLLERNGVNKNLAKILQAFIEGRAMILMTCDSGATSRTSTGELISDNRILAIVGFEPGQEPPKFLKPAVFFDFVDKEFTKGTIRALYQRYPKIVEEWVRKFMASIPQPTPTPQPRETLSNAIPTPVSALVSYSNAGGESTRQYGKEQSQQQENISQVQIQEKTARVQRLNAEIESVLPPIALIPESAEIDLNSIVNDIMLGYKIAPLHKLLEFFLFKPERLTVLQEYIQVLEDLTLVAEGENAQYLQDFLYKLKLVQLLVENSLTIGLTGLVLIASLFFTRRK